MVNCGVLNRLQREKRVRLGICFPWSHAPTSSWVDWLLLSGRPLLLEVVLLHCRMNSRKLKNSCGFPFSELFLNCSFLAGLRLRHCVWWTGYTFQVFQLVQKRSYGWDSVVAMVEPSDRSYRVALATGWYIGGVVLLKSFPVFWSLGKSLCICHLSCHWDTILTTQREIDLIWLIVAGIQSIISWLKAGTSW